MAMNTNTPAAAQDLREKLITVAIDLVRANGFAALTVRAVTSRAGCAIGMVYKIFDNLDDLALHVNAATLDMLEETMARPATALGAKEAVLELAARYIEFSQENFHLWSMLFEHRMEGELPEWFQEKMRRNFGRVEQAVAPLTAGDRALAGASAKVLWAALHGVCSLSISGKLDTVGAKSALALAEDLVENYLEGLQRRHASQRHMQTEEG